MGLKLYPCKSGGFYHWCPGCAKLHRLPEERWTFNGDKEKPTFSPSFLHTMRWKGVDKTCHYIVTDGVLNYCGDCSHALRGAVPMPDIPDERLKHLQEGDF